LRELYKLLVGALKKANKTLKQRRRGENRNENKKR